MHQLSCNSIPDCHTRPICEPPVHNIPPNVNYCVVPAKCVTNNGQIVSTDLVYCHDNDPCHPNPLHLNQKYITKTAKSYRVSPIKNGSVGFLVEKNLPFATGQSISCNILGNESNFFNGIVFDYDAETGFLSIGAIDNVTGNFSNSVVYNINLILFDPEVVKLKQRMDYLYKYLFQIELNATPNFNPVSEQLQFFDKKVYNLFLYLFDQDVHTLSDYQLTEVYLANKVDDLYEYLFEVKLDRNLDFNPNGFDDSLLNNLKIKIYQIYIYLFSINLEQSPWFNPNTTNN
jgi:hypothetical protein